MQACRRKNIILNKDRSHYYDCGQVLQCMYSIRAVRNINITNSVTGQEFV